MVDELILRHLPLIFTAGEWVQVSIRESGHGRIGWYDHGLVVASFELIAIVNTLYRDKWLSIDTIMIPILVLLWNFSHLALTATRLVGRSYQPGRRMERAGQEKSNDQVYYKWDVNGSCRLSDWRLNHHPIRFKLQFLRCTGVRCQDEEGIDTIDTPTTNTKDELFQIDQFLNTVFLNLDP